MPTHRSAAQNADILFRRSEHLRRRIESSDKVLTYDIAERNALLFAVDAIERLYGKDEPEEDAPIEPAPHRRGLTAGDYRPAARPRVEFRGRKD